MCIFFSRIYIIFNIRISNLTYFSCQIIAVAFVVVVIGGLGSFWGVVLAALLVGVVRGVTIYFVPAAGEASMYVLMFLVLMFRPRGLLGERIEKFE